MIYMRYLFTVEKTFTIADRGIMLVAAPNDKPFKPGNKIKLVLPGKTEIETQIVAVVFETRDIIIDKNIRKEDVPIGTEVWLYD